MIVKMSKVEIIGPKEFLDDVLNIIQEQECMQLEHFGEIVDKPEKKYNIDEKEIGEKVFLQELKNDIIELLSYLPDIKIRESYINPIHILDFLKVSVKKHKDFCINITNNIKNIQENLNNFQKYKDFLNVFEDIAKTDNRIVSADAIGLVLTDKNYLDRLNSIVKDVTYDTFNVYTRPLPDGSLAVIYLCDKRFIDNVRKKLYAANVREYQFPSEIESKSFFEKLSYIMELIKKSELELKRERERLHNFAVKWLPIYKKTLEWINKRLEILKAKNIIYETLYCFVIFGWLPTEKLKTLKEELEKRFSGKVVVNELKITEADLGRVPVVLKNSTYFKPFELFTKILPLPSYASFDPTIFIGIFFPLFFGMILGDSGYGMILLVISIFMVLKGKKGSLIEDAGKIMSICSIYTIIFGFLYGEFFGTLGKQLFGLKPILIDREEEIIPMAFLAISIGAFHILLGIVLNAVTQIRSKNIRKTIASFSSAILIAFCIILFVVFLKSENSKFSFSLILIIAGLTLLLIVLEGLLAPLEILKSMGNIISYVRIMAIGLASVMLAHVANMLSGKMGNIFLGVFIAALLHLLNLLLGLFSPAIHSIRLNYVEFFSKFLDSEGRDFKPLKK